MLVWNVALQQISRTTLHMLLSLELLFSLKSLWYGSFCVLISIYKIIFAGVAVVYFNTLTFQHFLSIHPSIKEKKPLNDFQAFSGIL